MSVQNIPTVGSAIFLLFLSFSDGRSSNNFSNLGNPEYCEAYPNATEHRDRFPHTSLPSSRRCGEIYTCATGGIFHKSSEAVLPNERCVWTIAVPKATGYEVAVHFYGYTPSEDGDIGVVISDFGRFRTPKHFILTTTDKVVIANASMLVVTFYTGPYTDNQKGFILEFSALFDTNLGTPVNADSAHEVATNDIYISKYRNSVRDELSSYLFYPTDGLSKSERLNRVYYLRSSFPFCNSDENLKVYLFNSKCTGPNKWQYHGRICATSTDAHRYDEDEIIETPEPVLIIFEATTRFNILLRFVYTAVE